jgi:hypothetical protein
MDRRLPRPESEYSGGEERRGDETRRYRPCLSSEDVTRARGGAFGRVMAHRRRPRPLARRDRGAGGAWAGVSGEQAMAAGRKWPRQARNARCRSETLVISVQEGYNV